MAKCLCVVVVVAAFVGSLMVLEWWDFVVSRRQFARPAVLLRVLDQIIWTPQVLRCGLE